MLFKMADEVSRDIAILRVLKPRVLWNIGYPSETHVKLKSREISFAHNLFIDFPILLNFSAMHGSITAVLSAKFQNDWSIERAIIDERVFARFEFKMSFGRISYMT